jgi:hypothetical protein
MSLCSFTEKEKVQDDANWLVFRTADGSRRLGILFPLGSIEYDARQNYGPTNLIEAVPTENEVLRMAADIFPRCGVSLSEVERRGESSEPNFHFFSSLTTYFINRTAITNVEFRGIRFRRAVNGALFVGAGTGGNCEIRFGDHGRICKLSISWRNLERHKALATAGPERMAQWMRQGRAVQGMLPADAEPIDWKTVRRATITGAKICYYAGSLSEPSEWLMPFAALWARVDRGHGTIEVEIDCPIVEHD